MPGPRQRRGRCVEGLYPACAEPTDLCVCAVLEGSTGEHCQLASIWKCTREECNDAYMQTLCDQSGTSGR